MSKLTWNEDNTVVSDKNNNSATLDYWGSIYDAEKSLKSLKN